VNSVADEHVKGGAMRTKRKVLATIGAAAMLGVAGVGGAEAVGGGSDDVRPTGPGAAKAEDAALEAVGGGRVVSVEAEDEPGSAWEVEIVRADGTEVEAELDSAYRSVGVEPDDEDSDDADDND
jgi:hypothetical protein